MAFPMDFLRKIIRNIKIYLWIRSIQIIESIFWYPFAFFYPTAVFLYSKYLQRQMDQLSIASREIKRRNDRAITMSHTVQDQMDEAFGQIEDYEWMYSNRDLNNNANQVHHLNRIRGEVDNHRVWLTDFRHRWEEQVIRAIRDIRLRLAEHIHELNHCRQVIDQSELIRQMYEVVPPNLDWMRDYPNPTIEMRLFVDEWKERNLLRQLNILFSDLVYREGVDGEFILNNYSV